MRPAAQAGRCACPGAHGAGAPATAQPVFRYPGAGPARRRGWPCRLRRVRGAGAGSSGCKPSRPLMPSCRPEPARRMGNARARPALQPGPCALRPVAAARPDGTLLAALQPPALPPTSSAPAGRCTSAVAWSSSWHWTKGPHPRGRVQCAHRRAGAGTAGRPARGSCSAWRRRSRGACPCCRCRPARRSADLPGAGPALDAPRRARLPCWVRGLRCKTWRLRCWVETLTSSAPTCRTVGCRPSRAGAPGAVGWRRWRSALWLCLPDLSPLQPTWPGLEPLCWALLGELRDLDVACTQTLLHCSAGACVDGSPPRAADWERTAQAFQQAAAVQRKAVRLALQEPMTGQALLGLVQWIAAPLPQAAPPHPGPPGAGRACAPNACTSAGKRPNARPATRPALHRARLLAKRLRYTIEALLPPAAGRPSAGQGPFAGQGTGLRGVRAVCAGGIGAERGQRVCRQRRHPVRGWSSAQLQRSHRPSTDRAGGAGCSAAAACTTAMNRSSAAIVLAPGQAAPDSTRGRKRYKPGQHGSGSYSPASCAKMQQA